MDGNGNCQLVNELSRQPLLHQKTNCAAENGDLPRREEEQTQKTPL